MCRDDELALVVNQAMEQGENGELPLRRKGGFRFVEEIKPAADQTIAQEREEGFAVRLLVQGFAAVAVADPALVDLARDVVKTFGPEEPAIGRIAEALEREALVKTGGRGEIVARAALPSTLGAEARFHCDRFKQR